jgi:transposase-like protein
MLYIVLLCPFCRSPRIVRANQKTALCYTCNKRFKTIKCKKLYSSDNLKVAMELLKRVKISR